MYIIIIIIIIIYYYYYYYYVEFQTHLTYAATLLTPVSWPTQFTARLTIA